jgi:hypothetical protein
MMVLRLIKVVFCLVLGICTMAVVSGSSKDQATAFLQFIYGGDAERISEVCLPTDDLWMLRGTNNPTALEVVKRLSSEVPADGELVTIPIGGDLTVIEWRNGRIDPSFNLEAIQMLHRKLIYTFLYACIHKDKRIINLATTDGDKVETIGTERRNVDRFEAILPILPLLRSSSSAEDAKTRSITYRFPVGNKPVSLRLIKRGNAWKIDSSEKIRVDLSSFLSGGTALVQQGARTTCDVTVKNDSGQEVEDWAVSCGRGEEGLGVLRPGTSKAHGDVPAYVGASVEFKWKFVADPTVHTATNVLGRAVRSRDRFTIFIRGNQVLVKGESEK